MRCAAVQTVVDGCQCSADVGRRGQIWLSRLEGGRGERASSTVRAQGPVRRTFLCALLVDCRGAIVTTQRGERVRSEPRRRTVEGYVKGVGGDGWSMVDWMLDGQGEESGSAVKAPARHAPHSREQRWVRRTDDGNVRTLEL